MSNATQTANGKYNYSDLYHGKTLDEWVQGVNRLNCIANNWRVNPLKKGGFGYDNLAICIGYLFDNRPDILSNPENEELADIIHKGWTINYTYWRDNTPWSGNKTYNKPASPLNDERRNKCAELDYKDLPEDEKEKDRDIARFVLSILKGE